MLRRGGQLGWVVGCSLGGERWDREEEGEIEKESVDIVYIGFYQWNHQQTRSVDIPVCDSVGECVTSLYRDPSLNTSIIPFVKSFEKNPRHRTIATFQKTV